MAKKKGPQKRPPERAPGKRTGAYSDSMSSTSRPPGRRQSRQQQRRQPAAGLSRKTLVALVAAVVVLLVAASILVSLAGNQAASPSTPSTASGGPGEGSTKGSPEASISVEEFSDFQCPFCARFAIDTFPRIEEKYVKTGQVRWTFRHMARIGPESVAAAQAAECAGEQGQFWAYHDKLFRNQQGENRGAFSSDRLRSFAGELGLDAKAFSACLDSGRWAGKVNQDLADGQRKGVKGTPSFFIGGKMVEGAQPFSAFESAIEEALGRKS